MELVNSLGNSITGGGRSQPSLAPQSQPLSSASAYVDAGNVSGSEAGPSSGGGSGHVWAAGDVSTVLLEVFKQTLAEAESYLAVFEARSRLEEDYVRGLKVMCDKARDSVTKHDARLASMLSSGPAGNELPGARVAWRELLQNQLRELDARMHYIETLRQSVIAPLSLYRDAQERIRKRVKDDLKTSISAYDDMRHHTLPRAKKAYDKKCEELEQVRLHQQAIEDQKALLSQSNLQRTPSRQESSGEAFSPTSSAPSEPDEERNQSEPETAVTSPRRSSSLRAKRKTRRGGSDGSDLSGSRQQAASESASPRLGGEASLGASPPSHASGDRKGHFLDALRSREHWEAARKEAPKKINALISRMREGGSSDKSDAGVYAASPDSGSGATSLGMSLGAGPGSLRSNQNMALRHVKAKRESEEADAAYRKAVFDLETLRLRREKTILAARASVLDARRELYRTCQAVWIQAEKSVQLLANAHINFSKHAEDFLYNALNSLEPELDSLDDRLPGVEEERVRYVNFYMGECKDLIFGVSLVDYAFSRAQQGAPQLGPARTEAPLIVRKCITFIEERALDQPGIYRTSAKHTAIKNLAHALERDEERFDFGATDEEPATVAGLLKLYLRQLPEPVMPMPWEERVKYTHERQEHIQTGFAALKGRIRRLPAINQATLRAIVQHAAKIASHAEQNKMTASNLSIIFGPLLLSQADHETTSIAAAMEEDRVTEDLILYADTIFDLTRAGAPILPPVPSSMAGTEKSWDTLALAPLSSADVTNTAGSGMPPEPLEHGSTLSLIEAHGSEETPRAVKYHDDRFGTGESATDHQATPDAAASTAEASGENNIHIAVVPPGAHVDAPDGSEASSAPGDAPDPALAEGREKASVSEQDLTAGEHV